MLNPIEEMKFKQVRQQCRELKLGTLPDVFIGLKVRDKNGVLIFDDVQRGHSWTRNYYGLLFGIGCDGVGDDVSTSIGAGKMASRNTSGTVNKGNTYCAGRSSTAANQGMTGQSTVASQGIAVGTGNTAFSVDDYLLAAGVAHGNGAGQLQYNASGPASIAYDNTAGAEKWTSTLSRIFNNNSGGSIVIAETGIFHSGGIFASSGNNLVERSVLSPTVTVPSGAQLTVSYSISMDFSAID